MHIGFLAPNLSHNTGWAHYSLSIIEALQARGIRSTVISASNSPETSFEQHRLLPAVSPPQRFSIARMLASTPEIRRLLQKSDLVHCTAEPYALLQLALAQPGFITVHGSYVHLPRTRRFPVNALYQRAYQQNTLICVSHYTERVAKRIVPSAKTAVINNGINAERFLTLVDTPHETPENSHLIITAGGVKFRKGTLQLVEAIAKVRDVFPELCCQIIGTANPESVYVQQVQQRIHELNLGDCVQMMGFVDEAILLDAYAKADLFVMPAMSQGWKFEGFGLTYLEASAAGLPVIGTRDCGAEDAIVHEVTGLLVSQENISADLPAAMLDILSNPQKARQMGAAGRDHARQFTWSRVAEGLVALYEQTLMAKQADYS